MLKPYELFEYQKEGVEFIEKRIDLGYRGCILADEMGLGKTIQACQVIKNLGKKTLVVGPLIIRSQWEDEFEKWGINATFTNYERLAKVTEKYDLVVFDEAHLLNNHNKRYDNAIAVVSNRPFVLMLTATPIQKNEKDLISLFNVIGISVAKSQIGQARRKYIIQRTLKQLEVKYPGLKLPGISVEVVYQEMTLKDLTQYKKMHAKFRKAFEKKEGANLHHEILGLMGKCRKFLSGSTKMDAIGQDIHANLDTQSVVFCSYYDEAEYLVEYFKKHDVKDQIRCINGETPIDQRQDIITQFQNNEFAVLVMQIKIGYAGLNLQNASRVYVSTVPYNGAVESQAIARVHRTGQKSQVKVKRYIMYETLEERVLEIQAEKLERIQNVFEPTNIQANIKWSMDDIKYALNIK